MSVASEAVTTPLLTGTGTHTGDGCERRSRETVDARGSRFQGQLRLPRRGLLAGDEGERERSDRSTETTMLVSQQHHTTAV